MGLKIGSLYVSLTAQTGEFAKGMAGALKSVERFSKEVKKAAGDAMGVGASLTAVAGGALKLASDVSGPTKRALDELSASTKQLAVPLAEALVPAVREASNVIRGIGQAFKELSPETKRAVVTVLEVGAAMTAVGAIVGKLAGTVNLLAGVFSGVFSAVAAIGIGPLLGIVAAIGAVIGGIALLHRAWRQNWGGIREATASVVEAIKAQFTGLVETIGKVFDWIVDMVATYVDRGLELSEKMQKAFGVQLVDTRALRAGFQGLFADLKSGEFFNQALQFGKTVGKQLGAGLVEEWKLIGKQLGIDELAGKLRGVMAGAPLKGGPATPSGPIVSGAMMRDPRMVDARSFLNASAADERARVDKLIAKAADELFEAAQKEKEAAEKAIRDRFNAFNEEGRKKNAEKNAALEAAGRGTRDSLTSTAQQFVGKLGELGNVIQSVANAAMQGGPWAALAAAIAELLTRTQAFLDVLLIAANGLKLVTDALEGGASVLFRGLGGALATALNAVAAAVKMIEPILVAVGDGLLGLAPLFMPLATIFKSLTPVIELLADVIFSWVRVVGPIVAIIQTVVIGVGIAIAWTIKQIGTVWNAIVTELANVVDDVIAAITLGAVQGGGKFVRDLAMDVTPAAESLRELNEQAKAMGYGTKSVWEILSGDASKQAAADFAESLKKTSSAANAVSEAFLNVPTGYKVAAARFAADAGGLTQFSMPGGASAGSGVTINGDITIVTNDPELLWQQVLRAEYRQTGSFSSASLARAAKGG